MIVVGSEEASGGFFLDMFFPPVIGTDVTVKPRGLVGVVQARIQRRQESADALFLRWAIVRATRIESFLEPALVSAPLFLAGFHFFLLDSRGLWICNLRRGIFEEGLQADREACELLGIRLMPFSQNGGKRIEETPQGPGLKILKRGVAPFADDAGKRAMRNEVLFVRTQQQGVGMVIGEIQHLELFDALCFGLAEDMKGLNGQGDGFREAGLAIASVLAVHQELALEAQVIAHKHAGAGTEAERQGLVDGIAEADGKIDASDQRTFQVERPEETGTFAREGEGLFAD
jgi:hypothetical protein